VRTPITNRIKHHMTQQNEVQQPGAAAAVGATEPFISKKETARRLDCGMRTLDTWMKRGIVPFYKISKKVAFKWSEIQLVLERNCRVDRGGWKV
jgi:hypothetical protein